MAVDSEAVFIQRLSELGLTERAERFKTLGWRTHGLFAFALPAGGSGVVNEDDFVRTIVRPVFELADDAPLPPAAAAVRRLWFESHTITVGDLRQKVERTDSDMPRKVPQAEREARKELLRAKLAPTILLEADLEPANCVIDRVIQMLEEGVLEYVAWEDLPKRDQELATAPSKKRWAPDGGGIVKEQSVRAQPVADISTSLRISLALQRRGYAMELGGLMSCEVHEKIRAKLIGALMRESPDERYSPASLDQVRAADREIWKMLSRQAKGKLRAPSSVDRPPLEALVDGVLASMDVNLLLMPLAKAGGGDRSTKAPGTPEKHDKVASGKTKKRSAQVKKLREQLAEAKQRQHVVQRPQGGAPKGGGKGKQKGPAMPRALVGGVAQTADGKRICFGFNLGSCSKVQPGEECDRGLHLCTKKGCGGRHPASECPL